MITYEYKLDLEPGDDTVLYITKTHSVGKEVVEVKETYISLEQAKGIQEFMNAQEKV